MTAPGLGASQRGILDALKRRGASTIPELARVLSLHIETVREHLRALVGRGWVRRDGNRRDGPGRPEAVYRLTPNADVLFPNEEGQILEELAAFLKEGGHESLLRDFFDRRIGARRESALARVRQLEGQARLEEVARILSELGFMALVEPPEGRPTLRLCHCPLRGLVKRTKIPCLAEIRFISELLDGPLARMSYIPAGGTSCSYQVES